jgi:hypothetical protein
MTNKQQIVDLLIDADHEFWSHEDNPPTKRDLKVGIIRYNFIAEKISEYIQSQMELARQQGYDSAFVTWKRDSAEFYK